MKKLCVGCEGIVCGERQDMYCAQARFLEEYAPGRPLSEALIVAGDGFFDQSVVVSMGFTNATFIVDHWHLYDSGLNKMFGHTGYDLLRDHLVRMIQSKSAEEFNGIYNLGRMLLENQMQKNGQLMSDFETFASNKIHYAEYCITQLPGNRG